MAGIIRYLQSVTKTFVSKIFSGKDVTTVASMLNLISGGFWLNPKLHKDDLYDLTSALENILLGLLMYRNWTKNEKPYIL